MQSERSADSRTHRLDALPSLPLLFLRLHTLNSPLLRLLCSILSSTPILFLIWFDLLWSVLLLFSICDLSHSMSSYSISRNMKSIWLSSHAYVNHDKARYISMDICSEIEWYKGKTAYLALLCYDMICYAMLFYAMMSYAMLCYDMLYYAVLCYAMLCYAMLCYAAMLHYILILILFSVTLRTSSLPFCSKFLQ